MGTRDRGHCYTFDKIYHILTVINISPQTVLNISLKAFRATRKFHSLGVHFILCGSDVFSEEDNFIFFGHVHRYIKDTKRFVR